MITDVRRRNHEGGRGLQGFLTTFARSGNFACGALNKTSGGRKHGNPVFRLGTTSAKAMLYPYGGFSNNYLRQNENVSSKADAGQNTKRVNSTETIGVQGTATGGLWQERSEGCLDRQSCACPGKSCSGSSMVQVDGLVD